MSEAATEANRAAAWIRRRPVALLFFLCFLAWLPGFFTLPPLDRDESRFAESSKQMLESGNFVDIRFGAEPRYKKPVGIYWLQAATTRIAAVATGDAGLGRIWTYRVPSLLGAFAAVAGVFWCARAFAGIEEAFLSALLLGATLLLAAEAKIAKTDAVLLATVVASQAVLLRVYLSARDATRAPPSRALLLAGWAAFAAGILVKGPVIVGVCAATVLVLAVWDREWRWLGRARPLMGIALTLALVLPWFIAIWVQSHGQFFQLSLGADFAAKLEGGQETHGARPGYYLLLTSFSFWPATLFLLPAIGAALARRGEPAVRFLLSWAGAWWLIVEIVPTKLPHYILPAYPALAILAGLWALAPREAAPPHWRRVLFALGPIQFLIGVAAFAAAVIVLPWFYGPEANWSSIAGTGISGVLHAVLAALINAEWPVLLGASAGLALGIVAAILMLYRVNGWAASAAFVSALTIYATLMFGVAPRLDALWVSPRIAKLVDKDSRAGDPPPALAGYEEPSLVFALGSNVTLTDGRGAAEAGAAGGGLALIEDRERPAFLARLAELQADAAAVDGLSGFNYSRGQRVHVTLYRVTKLR